jgi:Rne/Rng family ribonuclease
MAYEMIIDVGREGERIALLKDKKLVELHQESNESGNFLVGEIYLGKVKKIMPGLNAAFVDVGHEKDAFLHYHDLGPYIRFNRFCFGARNRKDRQNKPSLKTKSTDSCPSIKRAHFYQRPTAHNRNIYCWTLLYTRTIL